MEEEKKGGFKGRRCRGGGKREEELEMRREGMMSIISFFFLDILRSIGTCSWSTISYSCGCTWLVPHYPFLPVLGIFFAVGIPQYLYNCPSVSFLELSVSFLSCICSICNILHSVIPSRYPVAVCQYPIHGAVTISPVRSYPTLCIPMFVHRYPSFSCHSVILSLYPTSSCLSVSL